MLLINNAYYSSKVEHFGSVKITSRVLILTTDDDLCDNNFADILLLNTRFVINEEIMHELVDVWHNGIDLRFGAIGFTWSISASEYKSMTDSMYFTVGGKLLMMRSDNNKYIKVNTRTI